MNGWNVWCNVFVLKKKDLKILVLMKDEIEVFLFFVYNFFCIDLL